MGLLVISSLLLKRHREKPKRPWRIWCVPFLPPRVGGPSYSRLFDVSKQVVGQMFVHGVNVLISDVGSTRSSGNACVFYFLNILIDTTLGVFTLHSPFLIASHFCILSQVSALSTSLSISLHGSSPTNSNSKAFSPDNTALRRHPAIGPAKQLSTLFPSPP